MIDKRKSALFGRKIGQAEAGIGLDDTNSGKFWKIESLGDSLGANDDVDVARFDLFIESVKTIFFVVVAIESSNFSSFKETS